MRVQQLFLVSLLALTTAFSGPPAVTHRTRCAPPSCASPDSVAASARATQLKRELDDAVNQEEYELAALLRDELATLQMDDEVAVLQANAAFYEAFTSRDAKMMADLWAEGDGSVCAHPGFPPIRGHEKILDSWKSIFKESEMKIQAEGVRCRLLKGGLSAVVSCVERADGNNALAATNVYEKGDDGWKMVLHQAGPLVAQAGVSKDE